MMELSEYNFPGVYILRLEGNRIYVGETSLAIKDRIKRHINGRGASWTEIHSPIEIISVAKIFGDALRKKYERFKTLEMMKKVGWKKVRGGPWTSKNLPNPPLQLRRQIPHP